MIPLRVLDICSGAGYFSYGFKQAGYELDGGIDNWKPAVSTYNKYLPAECRLIDLIDYFPTRKDYDMVILAATPCQDFSRVNTNRNIFSKRAQLVLDFCRVVTAMQPDIFVFENVIGLSKWAEQALFEIKKYKITKNIVDTKYYGVPQSRRRKIFIGSKERHISLMEPRNYTIHTVKEAFSMIKNNWGFTDHRPETIEKFKKVKSTSWTSKSPNSDYEGVIRLSWNDPACAITNVKKAQILHPEKDRVISIAEAMALQGIPEWYIPEGNEVDQATQVGNAVPPKLAFHIAKRIKTPIQKKLM